MRYIDWVGDKHKWGVMGEKKWGILGNMLLLKEGGWRNKGDRRKKTKGKKKKISRRRGRRRLRRRGDNKKDFAGEELNQQKKSFSFLLSLYFIQLLNVFYFF